MSLLKLLSTGITISKNKKDLQDVSKAAEAMGIHLENWQIGAKKTKKKLTNLPQSKVSVNNPKKYKEGKKVLTYVKEESVDKDQSLEENGKRYSCEDCGKQYGRKDHLKRHVETHTGLSYPCVSCSSTFSGSYALIKLSKS